MEKQRYCSGLPRSGKQVWKRNISRSGKTGKKKKKKKKWQKSGNLENFWKQMAMAVSLIFRNINLQNRPHSLIKWLFNSLKVSSLLEDLMAEDSCKGSWEAVENVWKMVKSQEKVREYWNRKWVATLVAALKINRWHQAMIVELHETENEWQPWLLPWRLIDDIKQW